MTFGGAIFAGLPTATAPSGPTFAGAHDITLVEDRANEISVPAIISGGVKTWEMFWDDSVDLLKAAGAGQTTRISEFVKQLNKRYLGSSTLNNQVVSRCETVDADTGNRLVFTPGATAAGSAQDFEVVILDQDGDRESRGFLLYLQTNANPGAVDGGDVILRLTPVALPW